MIATSTRSDVEWNIIIEQTHLRRQGFERSHSCPLVFVLWNEREKRQNLDDEQVVFVRTGHFDKPASFTQLRVEQQDAKPRRYSSAAMTTFYSPLHSTPVSRRRQLKYR